MPEILDESLQEKLPADAAENRYFDTSDVAYALDPYVSGEYDDHWMSDYDRMEDELEQLGKIVSLKDLDASHIIERYVPADKVDEAETKVLQLSDPIQERLADIAYDVDNLLDDSVGIESLHLSSQWVKNQLSDFLEQLHFHYPRTAEEYMEMKDKSIMDM